MKNLKRKPCNLKRYRFLWVAGVVCLVSAPPAHAGYSETRDRSVSMLKSLLSVGAGTRQERDLPQVSTQPVSYSHAVAEMAAGTYSVSDSYDMSSGYFGTTEFLPLIWYVESVSVSSGGIPISPRYTMGVPLTSNLKATFSSPITSLCEGCQIPGLSVTAVQNHLGQTIKEAVAYRTIYGSGERSLVIRPPVSSLSSSEEGQWLPNTLYDVHFSKTMADSVGHSLNQDTHFYFVTVLDPKQDNVVAQSFTRGDEIQEVPYLNATSFNSIQIKIPSEALKDYSAVFLNTDLSIQQPVVSKQVMDEATRKAEKAQGAYRKPLGIHEVVVLGVSGERQMKLHKPITLSLSYANDVSRASRVSEASSNPITRAPTLSLFSLDADHQLWVKMAGTRNNPNEQMLEASFSQLPVLAIMGGPSLSAREVYVFPNPWRPFGPQAGSGAGQTGTTAGGIIFNNLPSECEIQIYTMNGEKVWGQTHSDALNTGPQNGQEDWDGKNHLGQTVASGVYLWHVKSAEDEKTGKLMIIR